MIATDSRRTNFIATVADPDKQDQDVPGAIRPFGKGVIAMACPGCGRVSAMRAGNPKPADSPSWLLIGDVLKPETMTLAPSINCVGCCGWHGYLIDGVYKSC